MVNIKIKLIIYFTAKDGEALYSQQKQERELTVAQIMNSLLPIKLKLKKVRKRSGRSPGEGNGNPLQYSCLENPINGGAWQAIVHGVTKSQT